MDVRFVGMTADGWIALATFLAALVPLVLFLFERRDRKAAEASLAAERAARRADEQAREREARSAQARTVAIWNDVEQVVRDASSGLAVRARTDVTVHVANHSELPVFDVWAWTQPMRRIDGQRTERTDRPNYNMGHWEVLTPGAHEWHVTGQAAPMVVMVEFTDANGTRWERWGNGTVRLQELRAGSPEQSESEQPA